jgi:hypothetical protein
VAPPSFSGEMVALCSVHGEKAPSPTGFEPQTYTVYGRHSGVANTTSEKPSPPTGFEPAMAGTVGWRTQRPKNLRHRQDSNQLWQAQWGGEHNVGKTFATDRIRTNTVGCGMGGIIHWGKTGAKRGRMGQQTAPDWFQSSISFIFFTNQDWSVWGNGAGLLESVREFQTTFTWTYKNNDNCCPVAPD